MNYTVQTVEGISIVRNPFGEGVCTASSDAAAHVIAEALSIYETLDAAYPELFSDSVDEIGRVNITDLALDLQLARGEVNQD